MAMHFIKHYSSLACIPPPPGMSRIACRPRIRWQYTYTRRRMLPPHWGIPGTQDVLYVHWEVRGASSTAMHGSSLSPEASSTATHGSPLSPWSCHTLELQ